MATEGDVADGQSKFVADFERHMASLANITRAKKAFRGALVKHFGTKPQITVF